MPEVTYGLDFAEQGEKFVQKAVRNLKVNGSNPNYREETLAALAQAQNRIARAIDALTILTVEGR